MSSMPTRTCPPRRMAIVNTRQCSAGSITRSVVEEAVGQVVVHVLHGLQGRRGPAAALPAEEERDPDGPLEQPVLDQPLRVPDAAVVEALGLDLYPQRPAELRILDQLVAVVQAVKLDRRVARIVVEALVVGVVADRNHVGPLFLEELLSLREPAVGNAVLDDRLAAVDDLLTQPAPAGNVEVGKLRAVGPDFLVNGVGAVEMANRRPAPRLSGRTLWQPR